MFDGLKEKLGKFREDVEEKAEEKEAEAEAADAETGDATGDAEAVDGDTAESVDAGPESPAATESPDPAADPDAETPATPADEADAEASADADAGAGADASTDADADAGEKPSTPEVARSEDSEQTERKGPGRLKRAAAFATGRIIIEEEDLEEPLWSLEMALLESDVEMSVAEEMLDTIREKMIGESRKQVDTTAELVEEALHDALIDVISVGQFDLEERIARAEKPVTIIFTGVNGVGKTTSIAKMSEWLEAQGYSSVLANGDTYRAGANEQIRKHAENVDRKLIAHEQGGDPAAVIYDGVEYAKAHDIDVVLGDTAGRLHTSNDLMQQLEKIHRVVAPDMTLFVDEAVAGQDAVQRAKKFDEAAEIDGAVLTKADADSSGGAAISIAFVTGKPILFLGTGQGYEDLERFVPEELVASLLGDEE